MKKSGQQYKPSIEQRDSQTVTTNTPDYLSAVDTRGTGFRYSQSSGTPSAQPKKKAAQPAAANGSSQSNASTGTYSPPDGAFRRTMYETFLTQPKNPTSSSTYDPNTVGGFTYTPAPPKNSLPIISHPMPSLGLFDELMLAKSQGHANRQHERGGKSRFSSVMHGETQYALQKQNLMNQLEEFTKSKTVLTAQRWLADEAEASLVLSIKQNNFDTQTAIIGAFDGGSSSLGSQTQSRFNDVYQAWRVGAMKVASSQKKSRITNPDESFAHNPQTETLYPFPAFLTTSSSKLSLSFTNESSLKDKIALQIQALDKQQEKTKEQMQAPAPRGGMSVLFSFVLAENSEINYPASIALLKVLQVASEKQLLVSANDLLILAGQAEYDTTSPFYGAFKDKKTKALFDAADTTWRKGAITVIQQNEIKTKYDIQTLPTAGLFS